MHRPDPIFRSYGVTRRRFGAMALLTTVITLPIGPLAATEAVLAIGEMAAPEEPIEPQLVIDHTNIRKQAAHATDKIRTKGRLSTGTCVDGRRAAASGRTTPWTAPAV